MNSVIFYIASHIVLSVSIRSDLIFLLVLNFSRLFPDTLQGGAVLEYPYEARIIIADSDDVYGVFGVDVDETYIEIDDDERYFCKILSYFYLVVLITKLVFLTFLLFNLFSALPP